MLHYYVVGNIFVRCLHGTSAKATGTGEVTATGEKKTVKYVPEFSKGLAISPRLPVAYMRQLLLLERVSAPLVKGRSDKRCCSWDEGLGICPRKSALYSRWTALAFAPSVGPAGRINIRVRRNGHGAGTGEAAVMEGKGGSGKLYSRSLFFAGRQLGRWGHRKVLCSYSEPRGW